MEEKNNITLSKTSKLTLVNQNQLSLTGVNKVLTSTENIIMLLVNNQNVIIEGNKLTVKKLDVENGILEAEGIVTAIKYSNNKKKDSIFKRVFG